MVGVAKTNAAIRVAWSLGVNRRPDEEQVSGLLREFRQKSVTPLKAERVG